MKLSYSMDLFFPPDLSNLETSKSRRKGERANPKLNRASRSSLTSILPLLSLSNLSKIA
uniref:Putative calcium-binding protein CML49 n=1 Tax=Rhizophora mucronata TaxID=61149 RepID=A0A2P2KYM9_RHIMU